MSNWKKIQTFRRLHQAELRKDILEQNGINSVVINVKDSLFLIGDFDLYVEEEDVKKARVLIDEFNGFTKINSFINMKPVLLFQKILQDGGIESTIKRRESTKYVLGNYELYIENELLEKTIPYLTGEKLIGWNNLLVCSKIRQTKFYVDLLAENLINTIIIKKKDSDYHLELINVYVKSEDYSKAEQIIDKLEGYKLIKDSTDLTVIEKIEESLANESIKAFIKKHKANFQLYVENENFENAENIIAAEKEWTILKTFGSISNAMYYKGILETANIPSIIVNEKDSSFLLGEIELFVEKDYLEKANEIFTNLG